MVADNIRRVLDLEKSHPALATLLLHHASFANHATAPGHPERPDRYRVVEAAGGREALALVEEGRSVELVLTDVVMPELGGLELAAEVARLRPGVPVIAMSGSAADEQDGVVFLQKPFTHETLTRAVREARDRQPALV